MAIDQWGWTEEDTILYIGITMAAGGVLAAFCFAAIGPLSKRFNEKLLLIFVGIIPLIVGRLVMMPMGSTKPPFIGNITECEAGDRQNQLGEYRPNPMKLLPDICRMIHVK